jgi:hypothetical protein
MLEEGGYMLKQERNDGIILKGGGFMLEGVGSCSNGWIHP